jgi:alpha-amylase
VSQRIVQSLLSLYALGLLCSCASAHHVSGGDPSRPETDGAAREVMVDTGCQPVLAIPVARWYHQAIGYEIFVRSFYDSDGDGIGDLAGIVEKLDYLNDGNPDGGNDLGATLLWLMPTFPSPSYHGYDVTDYRNVHPDYGTLDDLKALVQECDKRGVKVILDLVLNHSSIEHPWFVASADGDAFYRDWYLWSDTPLSWKRPFGGGANTWHQLDNQYYYGIFWSGMPDLNYTHAPVRQEMADVGRFWLQEVGVAGYRLDAVRYMVEDGPEQLQDTATTMAFWQAFSTTIHEAHPEALLLGEAWAGNGVAAKYHVGGQGLDLTFDFDLMEAIIAGIQAEDATDIEQVLCRFAGQFPAGDGDATFLGNHDLVRVASRLQENPDLVRLGAMLLFTLPGLPMVYYGQEIGMTNGPLLKDEHKRLPMQWDGSTQAGFTTGKPWEAVNANAATINVAAQLDDPSSLLSLYRSLIGLRQTHSVLATGGFAPLPATSKTAYDLWGFERYGPNETLAVLVNLSDGPALDARLTLSRSGPKVAQRLFPDGASCSVEGTTLSVGDVPAHSLVVVQL